MPAMEAAVDPLGRTLELDAGDLRLVPAPDLPERRTLSELRGLPALSQALTLTLETQIGSDPLHVTFGFDVLAIGANPYGVRTRQEYLRLQLVRALSGDRRVRQIRELAFSDLSADRRMTGTVLLETATASEVSLGLEVPRA